VRPRGGALTSIKEVLRVDSAKIRAVGEFCNFQKTFLGKKSAKVTKFLGFKKNYLDNR
jgi:hypothetical protein